MRPTELSLTLAFLVGCGGSDSPTVVRLVDHFDSANVEGSPQGAAEAPKALWVFAEPGDSGDPLLGWKAGPGVADLRVVDGKLTGRATTDFPIIYASRPESVDTSDLFHSLVVRGRTSEATELRAHFSVSSTPNLARLAEGPGVLSWLMEGRFDGSENTQAVTFSQSRVVPLAGTATVLIRPADEVGETFEIDSIRLVSQREHRADIPSGVGWQGLGEIFRETIVSRTPETFSIDVNVPGKRLARFARRHGRGCAGYVPHRRSNKPGPPGLARTHGDDAAALGAGGG